MLKKQKPLSNKQAIIALCSKINQSEGEGSVYTVDGKHQNLKISRWSTGIEDLDHITGGGIPKGRVIELYGAEAAGKTTLLYHLFGLHSLCLDVPIEGCTDCDTEYMSETGWKKISQFEEGEKVLQYSKDGVASFVEPLKYHVYDADFLWHVHSKHRVDMVISENHNVVYKSVGSDEIKIKPFSPIRKAIKRNVGGFAGNVPKTFYYNGKGIKASEDVIRLMVAIFADGHFPSGTTQCYVGLTKRRKIERLKLLLNKLDIEYRIKNEFFIFYAPVNCKHFPKKWYQMNREQLKIVFEEVAFWDGCSTEKGHTHSFCTSYEKDADFVQFVFSSLGYPAYITMRDRSGENPGIRGRKFKSVKPNYNVCSGIKSKIASLRKVVCEKYKTTDGKMYCFTTPSGMWVMRRNKRVIITGNTFDAERAKVFGNRKNQLLVYRAKYGEDAFNKVIKFAKLGTPMIGIDSVPSMVPKEDVEKVLKASNNDTIEEQRIGGVARLMNKYLPAIEEIIEISGTTLVFINQVRDKMNALMFGEKTDTPGGHKLKHACSLRIQVARKGWIEIPNKNPCNSATTEKIGLILKCKVVKSKVCNPMGECEIPLLFDRGFVSFSDLVDLRKEIMESRKQEFIKRKTK